MKYRWGRPGQPSFSVSWRPVLLNSTTQHKREKFNFRVKSVAARRHQSVGSTLRSGCCGREQQVRGSIQQCIVPPSYCTGLCAVYCCGLSLLHLSRSDKRCELSNRCHHSFHSRQKLEINRKQVDFQSPLLTIYAD